LRSVGVPNVELVVGNVGQVYIACAQLIVDGVDEVVDHVGDSCLKLLAELVLAKQ